MPRPKVKRLKGKMGTPNTTKNFSFLRSAFCRVLDYFILMASIVLPSYKFPLKAPRAEDAPSKKND